MLIRGDYMPELTTMAEKIILFRHRHNLSQFEFASDCGMSADNLGIIERGTTNPTLETMQKIAHRMGITVSELLDPAKPLPPKEAKETR